MGNKWEVTEELLKEDPYQCMANMMHETVDQVLADVKQESGKYVPNDIILTVIHRMLTYVVMVNGVDFMKAVLEDLMNKIQLQLEDMKKLKGAPKED